jgi:hypothetical protein
VKGTDNFGFAHWAYANQAALFAFLGTGRHFGEWYGAGIQRGYGLDTKQFALFNVGRFGPGRQEIPNHLVDIGLECVPLLYEGEFDTSTVDDCMSFLVDEGSCINHFDNPEGIIVFHHGTRTLSKVTFEHDDGKWAADV